MVTKSNFSSVLKLNIFSLIIVTLLDFTIYLLKFSNNSTATILFTLSYILLIINPVPDPISSIDVSLFEYFNIKSASRLEKSLFLLSFLMIFTLCSVGLLLFNLLYLWLFHSHYMYLYHKLLFLSLS